MIIGTSGYAGSGKDTVGKIIQLLSCTNLDKDIQEVLDNYEDNKWWIEEQSGWEIKKWAGKLKEVATLLTGIPVNKFEDQEFKKTNLGPEWDYEIQEFIEQGVYKTIKKQMTVRDLLQKLGTEGLRNGLHPNTWVNALIADYVPQPNKDVAAFLAAEGLPASMNAGKEQIPNWIITDTRFVNEAQAIKKQNGIIIRVERPGVKAVNGHPSEVGLEGYDFDYVITNDGSIEDLVHMVKEVLSQANII